ncbi:hypothetical protein BGW38_005740, partial [Lunasporangiospora selenospora]
TMILLRSTTLVRLQTHISSSSPLSTSRASRRLLLSTLVCLKRCVKRGWSFFKKRVATLLHQ